MDKGNNKLPDSKTMSNHGKNDMTKKGSQDGRRGFLRKLWGIAGIIAGAEMVWVFSGFFAQRKTLSASGAQKLIEAGHVADFRLNSVFPFRAGKFYLIRLSDGGFMALSLKCTHLGCSVMWDEEKKSFFCPCHASSFDQLGEVISPPAPRALDAYPVIIHEGMVMVDVAKPVHRKKFDKSLVAYA